MAFRALNTIPSKQYEEAKRVAIQVKRLANAKAAVFSSAGASALEVLATMETAMAFRDSLASIAATPGLAVYAQEQENDGTYDVVAEFVALQNAIEAVITEIVTTIPKSAGGYVEAYSLNADGSKVVREFPPGQLGGLITVLQAVDAAIT